MNSLQRVQKNLSESREKLNQLSMKSDRTKEEEAQLLELRAAHSKLETEYRTALEASTEPKVIVKDAETRELDGLILKASVGDVLHAALDQRSTTGATHELQTHYGLSPHQVALEQLETRAVTPAPTDVGSSQQPIIGQIFPDSIASFLGVGMPVVGTGEATFTVLTTGADVGTPANNAIQVETTGAFTASVLSPKRAQSSFFWSIEDEARLSGMEDALRSNLGAALSSKFDNLLLNDTDEGLLSGGLTEPSGTPELATWVLYKTALTSQVDGHFASTPDQIRLVIGGKTYEQMETVYRVEPANGGTNESAFELLVRKSGGVRVSSHVAAPSSTIQGAIAVRRPSAIHAVMPVWRGVTLIPDRITKAASGQVILTAVALWSLKVLRADGFGRLKIKVA